MTRELERLQWEKTNKITRAYGLTKGLLVGLSCCGKDINFDGLRGALEEIRDLLEPYAKGKSNKCKK